MYFVGYADYGLKIDVSERLNAEDARQWRREIVDVLQGFSEPFGVLVDLRGARPASENVQPEIIRVIKACQEAGMRRAAVLVDDAIVQTQSERFSEMTSSTELMRWFIAPEASEADAVGWLEEGMR